MVIYQMPDNGDFVALDGIVSISPLIPDNYNSFYVDVTFAVVHPKMRYCLAFQRRHRGSNGQYYEERTTTTEARAKSEYDKLIKAWSQVEPIRLHKTTK